MSAEDVAWQKHLAAWPAEASLNPLNHEFSFRMGYRADRADSTLPTRRALGLALRAYIPNGSERWRAINALLKLIEERPEDPGDLKDSPEVLAEKCGMVSYTNGSWFRCISPHVRTGHIWESFQVPKEEKAVIINEAAEEHEALARNALDTADKATHTALVGAYSSLALAHFTAADIERRNARGNE